MAAERPRDISFTVILCFASIGFLLHSAGALIKPGPVLRGAASQEASPNNGNASVGWDREGAAKYLDERMDLWFAKAKKLRTGETQTACVSCHMTIHYALARPALRRAMRVSAVTPQEARIIEDATRRVESYGAHQLLYDHDESKKAESRGTEAVLNALILANADSAQNRQEPGGPTRQAFKRLWETQRPDGAWDWLDFGLEPFETVDSVYYGATLAALAVGTTPGSASRHNAETKAGIEKLRGYLKEKYASQSLFNRTWLLLAATRLNGLLTKAQREALITELQARQRDDGGWMLDLLGPWRWSKTDGPIRAPGTLDAALLTQSDGYATGLIVYALRQAGLPSGHRAVSRGVQWLKANQREVQVGERAWPAWRAHSLNFDRERGGDKGEPWRRMFMSDAATAFAALALIAADR